VVHDDVTVADSADLQLVPEILVVPAKNGSIANHNANTTNMYIASEF
jgi:dethiobiotin synthetase